MRDGKLTYLDQVKFELNDWLKAQTGIDDVITASLAWLKSEHPEMHNSKRVVKELIEYVLDRPSIVKSGKSENSVYLGKADDNKMKDIVIDKGDKKVIHANRRKMTSEEKEAKRASEDALHSHTDTKPAGALTLGQDARLARFNDSIIPQNSAKDETAIKTHANPHVGTGLAGGTLNAKDENGNFDAEKFAKGFIYGLFGSKVTAEQGSKLEQAEAKQEVVKGEAKNQQFNNTNVDYTSAVKNIVERKELALRLDPKADILSVVKDFSKPIKTPIFTSKISVDKMLNHLADKIDGDRRLEYINLVKPTLEKPLFITQESINGAQRFRFFKTFIDEKDKVVKFLNIVEDKNGELIEITATPIKNTDLKNLLKGKVIWGGDTLSDLSTPQTAKQGSEADKAIISQNSAKGEAPRQHPGANFANEKIINQPGLRLNKSREKLIKNTDVSRLNDEQKSVYDVFVGERDKVILQGKDLSDLYALEQGGKNAGAKKIMIKHAGIEKTGGLSNDELLNIMDVVRNGKIADDSFELRDDIIRYAYDLKKEGINFRVVIDEFNDGKKIFDYYSDRNFIDYGTTQKRLTGDKKFQSAPMAKDSQGLAFSPYKDDAQRVAQTNDYYITKFS